MDIPGIEILRSKEFTKKIQYAESILNKIKATKIGKDAIIIGEVKTDNSKRVLLKTLVGGTRFVDKPLGEPIPRIC